ncbi:MULTISPECIES: outer membrane protein assembly factor BamE [Phaeobacter]|uniref:Beta-barrel assembly machine subunit BamE n=1 Tax=Phaeobacter inhibens TaxID=221822 RepID=A0A135IKC9_9RHOB|nr:MULTISPECIES: outer membrane protein assembly factor BamE [Phaeobacter]AUQ50461.1 Beta-barrel assembly machine subunit BamE [Phaeobacter inhibens]AUQ53809.1 Beta-barrel assembly machine subunit BamE [Phaeobacter inhibens]AUQ58062.1 Beta-barrel assembly machine subunit BamE [Phaeobacter inhibens]AUQ62084.1 Beta-barrel assembly machine subunit BamE [Phaeobacter inhibens]AUQ66978.1 Beta-barrel assembly machine subunit BamE [Phaeobacter inhibens]
MTSKCMRSLKAATRVTVLLVAGLAVSGCAMYRKHGYVPSEELLSEVVVGVDTKDSVAETVGVPAAEGVLTDGGYYYVSTLMRRRGPSASKPVSRELVAINFNDQGVVTGIERYGLEQGRVIPLQRRVTSSNVQDKTFLRQLLGSLGNFGPGGLIE